ncbi:MAG: hypothetical protein EOP59_05625 [Sphingomonadales bacterium]|nr:MAG: hypothetical protein EOP59_05625 [Sphingomonadales bacterium]
MIALALALFLQREPLPYYADATSCAALVTAQYQALDERAPQSRAAYDAMLFWSLAMSERARKDGLTAARFERDLADATKEAGRRLAAGDPAATADLARCVARVPR